MRKFLLAAAAVGALGTASALAQNATPNDPASGTAGVHDRYMNPLDKSGRRGPWRESG